MMHIVISFQAVQRGHLVVVVVWYDGHAKLWGWKDNIKLMLLMAQDKCWRKQHMQTMCPQWHMAAQIQPNGLWYIKPA